MRRFPPVALIPNPIVRHPLCVWFFLLAQKLSKMIQVVERIRFMEKEKGVGVSVERIKCVRFNELRVFLLIYIYMIGLH